MVATNIRGSQIADGANGVNLTVDVTGTLPVGNGGTGQTTLAAAGILVSGGALGTPSSGTLTNCNGFGDSAHDQRGFVQRHREHRHHEAPSLAVVECDAVCQHRHRRHRDYRGHGEYHVDVVGLVGYAVSRSAHYVGVHWVECVHDRVGCELRKFGCGNAFGGACGEQGASGVHGV
jgi:hypothetical protein